ncbi:MAG: clostripain-related cysteine peptidase [bacterium]
MKKLCLILLLITAYSLSGDVVFAVYMATDNSMYSAYCQNIEQMKLGSATVENTKIHVFADTPLESYKFIIHDSLIDTVSVVSNVNSGDPKVISDFFSDVFVRYPNDIKIAVIWDHGNGWYNFKSSKSVLFDSNPDDFISVTEGELREIFYKIMNRVSERTDIVVFDACKMQTLEVAYELTGLVDYIVASEDSVPYLGMPYADVLKAVDSSKSSEDAGRRMCEEYYSHYESLDAHPVISLMKLSSLEDELKGISFEERESFTEIDSIDVSVSLQKSIILNKSYSDKFKGAKLFYPVYFEMLNELYPEYIKLKLDIDFDIVRKEFIWHAMPDTFKPLPVETCTLLFIGNENYRVFFNESFDFSKIAEYNFRHSADFSKRNENFNSLPPEVSGTVILSDFQPNSKPYSLYAKSLTMNMEMSSESNLVEFYLRGIFAENPFTVKNNGEVIYSNNRYTPLWKPVRFLAEKGVLTFEFNTTESPSQDYLYLDDLSIYGFTSLNTTVLKDTTGICHKMFSGENTVFVTAVDEFGNVSDIGEIFAFAIIDSVKAVIYPNPAKDRFKIKTEYEGDYILKIFTASGGLAAEFEGRQTNREINVELENPLKPGIYFYVLIIGGKSMKGKIGIIK